MDTHSLTQCWNLTFLVQYRQTFVQKQKARDCSWVLRNEGQWHRSKRGAELHISLSCLRPTRIMFGIDRLCWYRNEADWLSLKTSMHEGFFEAEVADHSYSSSRSSSRRSLVPWHAVETRRIWLQTSGGRYLDASSANIDVDDVEHVTDGSTYSSMCRTRRPCKWRFGCLIYLPDYDKVICIRARERAKRQCGLYEGDGLMRLTGVMACLLAAPRGLVIY